MYISIIINTIFIISIYNHYYHYYYQYINDLFLSCVSGKSWNTFNFSCRLPLIKSFFLLYVALHRKWFSLDK